MKVIKTACNLCQRRCGIDVYTENGKVIKVTGMDEHPFNMLCVKARAIPELLHSPERLTNPLKRVNGEFRPVSWDEALDFIADRLTNIKQKYGPESFVAHLGMPLVLSYIEYVARRFCDLYGTPNYTSGTSLCFLAKTIGHRLTCGAHVTANYSATTRCILLWGINPAESDPAEADAIHSLLGRGAKLIVIDPRHTPLAKQADIYAQIRPGTDCALALGMLNVIITEGLYDRDFVKQWTVGFDQLIKHVSSYTPEKVEAITWVKADTVRNLARVYAGNKPGIVSLGISMDHCTNGIQAIRAITTLIAITGNIDIPGGNVYTPPLRLTNLRLVEKVTKRVAAGMDYPIFTKYTTEQQTIPLIDQMLTEKPYPIKGLLVIGCNPALTWPNTDKFKKGRRNLDLMVVVDVFMTDTAKMADVILPGTTFLERSELRRYPMRNRILITLANRVAEPVGNSMEESRILTELGKRMGYADYFPWKDADELFQYLLKESNITLDQLRQNPGGVYYAQREFQKYLTHGFDTPSKKVEIYSELLAGHGYDPLPTFHEPEESLVSRPDLAERYPLIFVSGPRTITYLHSQCRNLPSLRKLAPEPLIEINLQTAIGLGISDGDLVTVESLRGSIKLKARLTEDIHPGVVAMQHGWSEANCNYLTDDETRDPISGYPGLRSVLCRVVR